MYSHITHTYYTHTHTCTHTYEPTCARAHGHPHAHTHMYTYTHMHTQIERSSLAGQVHTLQEELGKVRNEHQTLSGQINHAHRETVHMKR